jgi:hypothetical protein
MGIFVAVDLGIRGCGISAFDATTERKLIACDYIRNPIKAGNGPFEAAMMAHEVSLWLSDLEQLTKVKAAKVPGQPAGLLCMEWPRIYQRGDNRTKGDPNDLRCLWSVGGAIAALSPNYEFKTVEPAGWKGQTTHAAIEVRVASRLDVVESQVYELGLRSGGKTFGHNVTDAVGIGLHLVGRFDKVRIIHRESRETTN